MKLQATQSGFTLMEMIVVIVLTGILGTFLAQIISRPISGFIDTSRRAELVDIAELAQRRMTREIRLALPNSLRLRSNSSGGLTSCTAGGGSSCSVEFLRTLDGGRYRAKPAPGPPAVCVGSPEQARLSFNASSDCFEVLGPLTNLPDTGGNQTACMQGTADCLVIYNTGQQQANAYNGDNIAGITAATADSITFDISGGAATSFPFESPRQRFHIVDMPVSYVCDSATGVLTRQADYTITAAQALNPGGTVAVLANNIASCTFTYSPGTSTRNGLLSVDIRISTEDTQGTTNNVRLVEQIQVPNIP